MRVFEIYDTTSRGQRSCATLEYDEEVDRARILIDPNVDPDNLPFLLAMFKENGRLEIEGKWAKRWIEERIPPSHRQNIGEILRANNLEEYDEIALLVAGNGRSSQDDFQIREITLYKGKEHAGHHRKPNLNPSRMEYALAILGEEESTSFEALGKHIGSQIASARKSSGMTQPQLSERTGIAQAVISRIEGGKGNPTLDTLYTLCNGIGANLDVNIHLDR